MDSNPVCVVLIFSVKRLGYFENSLIFCIFAGD